jgi:diguanylate cyclase (GGDEF)-like protein/PAS domain S-box-containing protein
MVLMPFGRMTGLGRDRLATDLRERLTVALAAALLLTAALRDGDGLALAAAAASGGLLWRARAETRAALRQARERERVLQGAFHDAPIGMLLLSADPARAGEVVRVNPALERILGRSAEEISALGWEGLTHPDDLAEGRRLHDALAAGELDVTRTEKRYLHSSGHTVWAKVSSTLVRDDDGRPWAWLSQVEDISASRRAEAAAATQQIVTEVLARAASLDDVLPEVLILLSARLGLGRAAIWTADGADGTLRPVGVWPPEHDDDGADARKTMVGRAMRSGEPEPGAVPLAVADEVLAVLEYEHVPGYEPDAEDRALLATLNRQLALFLDRLRRTEQVVGLAREVATDPLTGLPNRRAWQQALPRELARAERADTPLCLAVLDLDHFKAFNDEHGHPAGDRLLRESADRWRAALRRSDLLARYGGEEFIVLLPDCDIEAAVELLEMLRLATPEGQTCSVGVARWSPDEAPEQLVARADAAMYAAKRTGRNRLVVASDGALV